MIQFGRPFRGDVLDQIKKFLSKGGLSYDDNIEYTVAVYADNNQLIAAGSLAGNVLKCIHVDSEHQEEGHAAFIVQHLINEAFRINRSHLFLFTKPENMPRFHKLGFYPIAAAGQIVLMENRKSGIMNFLSSLKAPRGDEIGAVVCNCNPFTNGHRHLIQTASAQCDWVHVFILSEDRSEFPGDVRFQLVKDGVSDLTNVLVHPTSDYLISYATFPNYFLGEAAAQANCELDLILFRDRFVKHLGITCRFVGEEPFSIITRDYNNQMKVFFAGSKLKIIEIPRLEYDGEPISASAVRRFLNEGNLKMALQLTPTSTANYLKQHFCQLVRFTR